jgi:hypothetical protein
VIATFDEPPSTALEDAPLGANTNEGVRSRAGQRSVDQERPQRDSNGDNGADASTQEQSNRDDTNGDLLSSDADCSHDAPSLGAVPTDPIADALDGAREAWTTGCDRRQLRRELLRLLADLEDER